MNDLKAQEIFKEWIIETHQERKLEIMEELEVTKDANETTALVAELRALRRIQIATRARWDRKNYVNIGLANDRTGTSNK